MPNPVAEKEGDLPGQVLSPNEDMQQTQEGADELERFGRELEKPNAEASPEDQKRYEFWQAKFTAEQNARKADAEKAAKLEEELAKRSQYDPVLNALMTDREAFEFVKNRIESSRAPAKTLEPPQRPQDYNEVEAFSNPESSSFKFRQQYEQYRDQMLVDLHKQNQEILSERKKQEQEMLRQRSQQEALKKLKMEAVGMGLPEDQFEEFVGLVNNAAVDDMVEFFNYKKGRPVKPGAPAMRPIDGAAPARPAKGAKGDDVGSAMLALSRSLM